jgi:hypothetical protein
MFCKISFMHVAATIHAYGKDRKLGAASETQ